MSNCNCNNNSNNCCRPTQGCRPNPPQNPCKDSCNTNAPVGFPGGYRPINDPSEACCRASIRAALQAIKDAVYSANIPGFGVSVLITTTNGVTYPIFISASTAFPLVLTKETLVYGNTVIDLDSIARIQIGSGALANPIFTNRLLATLRAITTCNTPGCGYSPLAITEDDDDNEEDITLTRGYCNNCNRPMNQCNCRPGCGCTPNDPRNAGIQDFINRNPNNIGEIEFEGGNNVISIPVLSTVSSVTVLAAASITGSTLAVVTGVTIPAVGATSVVASLAEVPVTVVSGLSVTTATIATGGLGAATTGVALSGVGAGTTIGVVGGITDVTPVTITPTNALLIGLPIGITITDTTSIGIEIPVGSLLNVSILGVSIVVPPTTIAIPLAITIPGIGVAPIDISTNLVPVVATTVPTTLIGTTGTPTIAAALGGGTLATIPVITSITAGTVGAATTVVTGLGFTEVAGLLPTTITTTTVGTVGNIVVTTVPTTSLVSGAFTTTQAISAVGLTSVSVLSPTTTTITGNVVAVGSGLAVVQELNGDITVYSVCKIDAVTSRI